MYKYVLFDLDGTLTDPKEGICKSTQYALHKMGIEEKDIDKLTTFIGPPLKDSFMRYYNMNESDAEKAIEFYRERFSVVGLYENIPYEGIDVLLKKLKEKGLKLAIASSKPYVYINQILEHFKLDAFFDIIEGAELDGRHVNKADNIRDAVLRLYYGDKEKNKKLPEESILSREVVMVGDRCYDIEGAHEFGIPCIGVSYGYAAKGELKKTGADMIAHRVEDIGHFIIGDSDKKKSKTNKTNKTNDKKTNINKINENEIPENKKDIYSNKAKLNNKTTQIDKEKVLIKASENMTEKGSFFKTVYVLVPFVLFYLVRMAGIVVGKVICDNLSKSSYIDPVYLQNNDALISTIIVGVANLIAGLVMILTYFKTDTLKIKFKKNIGLGALLGSMLAVSINMIVMYFFILFPNLQNTAPTSDSDIPIIVSIVLHGLIVPVAEELLFRYMIFGRIRITMGSGFAVILSALFFGLYHGNITQGIYAFIMGLALALIYYWSDNFLMPVFFHVAANITVLLFRYIPVDLTRQNYGGYVCAFALLAAIALLRTIYKTTVVNSNNK